MIDLLVIGGSGFVGGRLVQCAVTQGKSVAFTYAHNPIDLGAPGYQVDFEQDTTALADCLRVTKPRAIVYCAVPQHFSNAQVHQQVSVAGVERLIEFLQPGTRLVYVSSNSVFDGSKGRPYCETDQPEERHDRFRAYGLTRAEGEKLCLSTWPDSIVARTSNVEGRDAQGRLNVRLEDVVNRLLSGQVLPRFTDRLITPTWVDNLAEALLEVCQPDFAYRGVLHLAGSQVLTDDAFCRLVARATGADENLVVPDHYLPGGEPRHYSLALDTTFTQSQLRTQLMGAEEWIKKVFQS